MAQKSPRTADFFPPEKAGCVHEGQAVSRTSRPPCRVADRGAGGYALTPAVAALFDRLEPLERVAVIIELGRAMRAGRREALALSEEQAEVERRLWRDVAIRAYAHETYSALAARAKATAVAADMRRHPHIRRALGGEILGAERIRQILRGG
jgi:hypothetical protein